MGFRLSELGSDPHWPPKLDAQPRAATAWLWQPGLWCAGQHMPPELPNRVSQLDPKQKST